MLERANLVKGQTPLENDKPVSRQYKKAYYTYYVWLMYWIGPLPLGSYPNILHDINAFVGRCL